MNKNAGLVACGIGQIWAVVYHQQRYPHVSTYNISISLVFRNTKVSHTYPFPLGSHEPCGEFFWDQGPTVPTYKLQLQFP